MSEDINFPLVSPGVKVLIQLKSRRFYRVDDQGHRVGEDEFLPSPPEEKTVNYPDQCYPDHWIDSYESIEEALHIETICPDCISSWAEDWLIELADSQPSDTGY